MNYCNARSSAIALLVLLLHNLSSGWSIGQNKFNDREEGKSADFVCGPRCAQFVLEHYGKDVELYDLIREMQWPALEQGASVASIEDALQKRGVYTRTVRISEDVLINWSNPVIVHLESSDHSIGHYVVQFPSEDLEKSIVWVGLDGYKIGDAHALARRRSGVIIFTGLEPIGDINKSLTTSHNYTYLFPPALCMCCILILYLLRKACISNKALAGKTVE